MNATISIQTTAQDYITLIGEKRDADTKKAYKNALSLFLGILEGNPSETPVTALPEAKIGHFIKSLKPYAPATERLYAQAVKGYYHYLAAYDLAPINMAKVKDIIKFSQRPIGDNSIQFDEAEISAVIKFYESNKPIQDEEERLRFLRDRALILTLADTGLREHESAKLHRNDINWLEQKAFIVGKGNQKAVIRFSTRSLEAIKDYLNARQVRDGATRRPLGSLPIFARHDQGAGKKILAIGTTTIYNIIKDRCQEALGKESAISPHTFRHYFVTSVLRFTGNTRITQGLSRHKSIQMISRYAHLSDTELDQAYHNTFEKSQ